MTLGIIDYGIGNLRSVRRALEKVGAEVVMLKGVEDFKAVQGVVLPGVGHFGDCCRALEASGMRDEAVKWALSGRPFFGVCVGFQMLFESSEEAPAAKGLGILSGQVVRFQPGSLKVPQMGWNQVKKMTDSRYLTGIEDGDYVYFVHSYYARPKEASLIALQTDYGVPFASAVVQGNLFGTQFHPEKSQKVGLQLWRNFVELVAEVN